MFEKLRNLSVAKLTQRFRYLLPGVCRAASYTLTLFHDETYEDWYPIYDPNPKKGTLFTGKTDKNDEKSLILYRFSITSTH